MAFFVKGLKHKFICRDFEAFPTINHSILERRRLKKHFFANTTSKIRKKKRHRFLISYIVMI